MDNNCNIPDMVKTFSYVEKEWIQSVFIAS